jgi:hypothetical protein
MGGRSAVVDLGAATKGTHDRLRIVYWGEAEPSDLIAGESSRGNVALLNESGVLSKVWCGRSRFHDLASMILSEGTV